MAVSTSKSFGLVRQATQPGITTRKTPLGQVGRPWTIAGRNALRTTEKISLKDYVAFVHQFSGLTNKGVVWVFGLGAHGRLGLIN